jgi:anti-sigma regulatory factor (Ser/Thr protein kinase)
MKSEPLIRMTLRRDRAAASAARRALEQAPLPGNEDTHRAAALLATELINNAVLHGCGEEIRFEVTAEDSRLRVEVADDGDGFDPAQRTEREDPGGWGLGVVDAISDDWGMYQGSTHVWFELRA